MKTFAKRLLTMLLAVSMVFGLSGMTAFAAEADKSAEPEADSGEETEAASSSDDDAALSSDGEEISSTDEEVTAASDEEGDSSSDEGGIQMLTGDELNDIEVYKNGQHILTITAEEFAEAAAGVDESTLCYYSGGNYETPTYITAHFVKVTDLLDGYEPDAGCGIAANDNYSYAAMDLDNFYLYDDTEPPTSPYQYHGIRSAMDGSLGRYWTSDVTSLTLGHDFNSNGICRICGEELGAGESYNVKYAVCLWGIGQDTDRYGNTLGFTFGPATGADYTDDYKAHLTKEQYESGEYGVCLHWMSWEEIIEYSKEHPQELQTCLEEGCTHSVNLNLNSKLLGTSYESQMDAGDGASVLLDSINPTYLWWNSSNDTTGGWPASQMRATLNGSDRLTGSSASNALDASDSLLSCFPSELQSAIVAKVVPSDTVYDSQSEDDSQVTYDKLWLASGKEAYGDTGSNNRVIRANEGTLYDRSKILDITTGNAGALTSCCETGTDSAWWLRSLDTLNYGYVYQTGADGEWGSSTAGSNQTGIAPCFCLRGHDNYTNDTYYDVKYAVSIWGINHDVDKDGKMLGLTFGPATGESYLKDYKAHLTEEQYNDGEGVCLHWMTWEEIIEQSETDPTAFKDCLKYGCTRAVNLTLNDKIIGESYADEMDDGDGVGELFDSLNSDYREWNAYAAFADGGWAASKIRATLNGADSLLNSNNTDPLNEFNCLLSCFPAALQDAIVPRKVKAAAVAGSEAKNDITITHDSLWLFSASEMWDYGGGNDAYLNPMEGRLYERQIAWGITSGANALMANYREDGTSSWWFTRSKYTNSQVTYALGDYGYPRAISPSGSYAIAPGFCLPGKGEMMPTDKSVLQNEYDEDILFDENDYTPETWAPFQEALDAAGVVLTDEEVTQENVDDALEALRDAKAALIPKQPVLSLTVSSNIANNTKTYNRATVTLTAAAEVVPEDSSITYQWYKVEGSTETALPGETNYQLVLDGNVADSGTYKCVAIAQYEDLTDRAEDDITITINTESQNISYAETNIIKRDIDEDFINPLTRTLVSTDAESSITYTSSDDSIAQVNSSTGEVTIRDLGTVTITATAAATPNYTGTSASYTLKIYDSTLRVDYAVKIWGIGADRYSYDEGETTQTTGLTFGPATGDNTDGDGTGYINTYKAHLTKAEYDAGEGCCIHWMDWDEIIAQSADDPSVFEDCLEKGCTKTVELTPNAEIFNIDTVETAAAQEYDGDGVSTLYYLLNGTGGSTAHGAAWNSSYSGNSATDPANVYSRSRIRTTLTGDRGNITAWRSANSGANDYYGINTLCDETNCLLSCFPEELRNAVVPRRTLNSGNATSGSYQYGDKTTYDRLFLFSTKEAGYTYAYDDAGGDDYGVIGSNSERIAYEYNDTGKISSCVWWARSRYPGNNYYALRTGTNGAGNSMGSVSTTAGLSPGFSLPGPDGEPVPKPDAPTVGDVTVTSDLVGDTKTYNEEGVTLNAEAEVTPDTAEVTYQWSKKNASGTYEAIGGATTENRLELEGNVSDSGTYRCEVTATNDGVTASNYGEITITIEQASQNIYYEQENVEVALGEEDFINPLTVFVLSSDDDAAIRYTSSDPEVARVGSDGTVTILAVGETTITATAVATENFKVMRVSYQLKVVEAGPTAPTVGDVTITSTLDDNTTTYNGNGVSLTAEAEVSPNTADVTYQWYKKNESGDYEPVEDGAHNLLNIDGNVADSGTYKCVVTATNDGMTAENSGELTITIEPAAQKISYEVESIEKMVGKADFINPLTVSAFSTDDDAVIEYTSSNPEVARVDADGTVTILAVGETMITATAKATANFDAASASYLLTVVESLSVGDVTITSTLAGSSKTYDGSGFSLTASAATTPGTADVSYQWYKKNTAGEYEPVEDGAYNLLNIDGNVSDSGTYKCVVTATFDEESATGEAEITFTITAAAQNISYEEENIEKTIRDGSFTNPLTVTTKSTDVDAGIIYVSDNTDVATVDSVTGEVTIVGTGTAKITATAEATANFDEASASYTITVTLADKTALRAAIKAAEALEDDRDHYTPESWETYEEALSKAREVEADEDATEDVVRAATVDLMGAIADLEPVEGTESQPADKDALLDACVEAMNLSESDYTPESWKAVADALSAAMDLLFDPEAAQSDVDAAANGLNTAMKGLVKAVDKSALEEAIEEVAEEMSGLASSDYSPESWAALEAAFKAAQNVADDPDATQEDVDQAKNALTTAAAGLVKTADLQAEYDADSELSSEEYTPNSWASFAEALATAGDLLKSGDATQGAVDEALAALQAAKKDLVPAADKTALQQVMATAEALLAEDKDNYTEDTRNALQAAYEAAERVAQDENAVQSDADTAATNLIIAIANLQPLEQTGDKEVDKDVLKAAIDAVKDMSVSKDDYTTDSWNALQKVLTEAEEVYNNNSATQEAVNNAVNAISDALASLKPVEKSGTGSNGGNGGTPKNGLCRIEAGKLWGYYVNDVVDTSYTGFAHNDNGDWYVVNGYVRFDQNTVAKDKTGKNGDKGVGEKGTWYYVVGSKVQSGFTGLANYKNENGWWYIKDGKVDFTHNGVDKNKNGWYYVVGGKVRFDFTGLANYKNENGWWYIAGGKVDFTHNGVDKNRNGWYYVVGGKVRFDFTGLAHYKNKYGWWYIAGGKVLFNYTGIASNQNGTWYVRGSKVRFDYNGTVTTGRGTYTVRNGKVS